MIKNHFAHYYYYWWVALHGNYSIKYLGTGAVWRRKQCHSHCSRQRPGWGTVHITGRSNDSIVMQIRTWHWIVILKHMHSSHKKYNTRVVYGYSVGIMHTCMGAHVHLTLGGWPYNVWRWIGCASYMLFVHVHMIYHPATAGPPKPPPDIHGSLTMDFPSLDFPCACMYRYVPHICSHWLHVCMTRYVWVYIIWCSSCNQQWPIVSHMFSRCRN